MVIVTRYTDCRERERERERERFHCPHESRPARSGSSDVATGKAALSWLLGSKANGYCIRVGLYSRDMQCEDYGKPITSCPVGRVFGRVETCGSLSMCPSHRLMGLDRQNIHAQPHGLFQYSFNGSR